MVGLKASKRVVPNYSLCNYAIKMAKCYQVDTNHLKLGGLRYQVLVAPLWGQLSWPFLGQFALHWSKSGIQLSPVAPQSCKRNSSHSLYNSFDRPAKPGEGNRLVSNLQWVKVCLFYLTDKGPEIGRQPRQKNKIRTGGVRNPRKAAHLRKGSPERKSSKSMCTSS